MMKYVKHDTTNYMIFIELRKSIFSKLDWGFCMCHAHACNIMHSKGKKNMDTWLFIS